LRFRTSEIGGLLQYSNISMNAEMSLDVSLAFLIRGELRWPMAVAYIAAQIIGAVGGVWAAHLMFELPLL